MTALEVCLILIGIAALAASYFISEKISQERMEKSMKDFVLSDESKEVLKQQTKEAVNDILENMSDNISGKAEREMEKISNEKIMAVHDYSDTVLDEINRNHSEVMFLYSMLDDKSKEAKHTAKTLQDTMKTVQQLEEKWTEGEKKALMIQEQMERVEWEVQNMQVAQIGRMMQSGQQTQPAFPSDVELSMEMEAEEPEKVAAVKPEEPEAELQTEMAEESIPEPKKTEDSQINNNEKILRLYREGKNHIQIAKELGLGIGEVKLVIDLYKEVM